MFNLKIKFLCQYLFLPFLIYGPFLHLRVVRGHGDEKVYVGQILEMFQTGKWFEQIQFGSANYIKGPLFYLAGIAGMHVFGMSFWSVLWLNLLLTALAVFCLARIFKDTRLESWAPFAYISSAAIVQYQFTAQMESTLTSIYLIALALLYFEKKEGKVRYVFLFWLAASIAGQLKSPLHAVLLGTSALLLWCFDSSWRQRLKSPAQWLAVSTGILFCFAAYAPGYFLNETAFINDYLFRETLDRHTFVDPYPMFLLSSFVIHLLPWSLLFIPALLSIRSNSALRQSLKEHPLFHTCVAIAVPTFLFFSLFGHYAVWYGMPLLPPTLVFLALYVQLDTFALKSVFPTLRSVSFFLLALVSVCFAMFLFSGRPAWWPSKLYSLSLLFLGVSAVAGWTSYLLKNPTLSNQRNYLLRTAALLAGTWGIFSTLAALGSRETYEIETLLKAMPAQTKVYYANTERNNYSEWGLIALALGRNVTGVHQLPVTFDDKTPAIVMFPSKEEKLNLAPYLPQGSEEYTWKRWVRGAKYALEKYKSGSCSLTGFECLEREMYFDVTLNN